MDSRYDVGAMTAQTLFRQWYAFFRNSARTGNIYVLAQRPQLYWDTIEQQAYIAAQSIVANKVYFGI